MVLSPSPKRVQLLVFAEPMFKTAKGKEWEQMCPGSLFPQGGLKRSPHVHLPNCTKQGLDTDKQDQPSAPYGVVRSGKH